tara:strand:- start:47 stop:241 length:195 start_codon:yes stop_codon:yes gene_type:complete
MKLKIIDDSIIKKKNKIRDDSFKKFCDECDVSKIDFVNVIRNTKGEITLWEIHHKESLVKKSNK